MPAIKRCIAIYPPMLDLFSTVEKTFLKENKVAINTIVSYSGEKHEDIHAYMMNKLENKREDLTFQAGGATFNTQKILSEWMDCYFFGIVGCDSYGEIIEKKMRGTKVNIYLDKRSKFSTAWAYVFINEDQRTIIANQDKSVCYSEKAKKSIYSLVNSNTIFYFVSFMFFLENIVSDCMSIYREKKRIGFCSVVNLSSEEIVRLFREEIIQIIKMSDFIIGNKTEYFELSGAKDEDSLLSWLDNLNVAYAITDGPGEVVGKIPNGPLRRVMPASLPENAITNGAGDSFAAGFIGGLNGKSYSELVDILPLLEKGVQTSQNFIKSQGKVVEV